MIIGEFKQYRNRFKFQSKVDSLFTAIKEVEYRAYYQKEVMDLNILVEHVLQSIDHCNPSGNEAPYLHVGNFWSSRESYISWQTYLVVKYEKLARALSIASRLLEQYDEETAAIYAECKKEVTRYLSETDRYLLGEFECYSIIYNDNVKNELKILSNWLRALLYKRYKSVKRDLRHTLRSVTKFFLMGMGDEPDAVIGVWMPVKAMSPANGRFVHRLNHSNGKRGNVGSFKVP